MPHKNHFSRPEISQIRQTYSRNIAELVKELRYRDRLTQTQFSDRVGINRSLICQYESGEREPSFESIIKIAQYAKVSIDNLLGLQTSHKFNLTETEEELIGIWRKVPSGAEMNIKKEPEGQPGLKDYQVAIKQEVKL